MMQFVSPLSRTLRGCLNSNSIKSLPKQISLIRQQQRTTSKLFFSTTNSLLSDEKAEESKEEKRITDVNEIVLDGINENGEKLLQFFDKRENWGQKRIAVGRSWLKDELRMKSNEDLHKLWFVLLREKNSLLTMQEAYKDEFEFFPNEERIDKVEESMENLEEIVRERNRAYWELEIGESGERERQMREGLLGFPVAYVEEEHHIPYEVNDEYREKLKREYGTNRGKDITDFLQRAGEQHLKKKSREKHLQMRKCLNVLKRYPHVEDRVLAEKFPLVDLDLIKHYHKIRGHHRNQQWDV